MVFNYIEKNDPAKVSAILKYTDRKLNPYIYGVFTNNERELINFFLEEYEPILSDPSAHYHSPYRGYGCRGSVNYNEYESYGGYYPDIDFRYPINLNAVIASQAASILERIQTSGLSQEEKSFLILYFKYKVHYQDDLTVEAVQFINDYPESTHVDFVKRYIRRWYVRGDYSWDVYLGGGQSILTGDITETLLHRSTVFYGVDGSFNRTMVGARFATTYGEVLNEFSHKGDAFTNGMPIYTFNYNLTVGYSILDFDFLRLTPSVDFGGIFTSVPERKVEEFPEDPSIGAISYGFGGTLDIFPFQFANTTYSTELHRIGLRIHAGRFYNNLKNKNVLLDGYQDYIGFSIIYDGGAMKIDMD